MSRSMYSSWYLIRLTLCSLWGLLMATTAFGQSIQWSQLIGHTTVSNLSSSRAYAIERSSDGSLYVLGNLRKPTGIPAFQTADLRYYGTAGADQAPVFLLKYSSDGSTLLWARIIQHTTIISPMGLSLNTAGEPTIFYATNGTNPDFVTTGAWQPSATISNGGSVGILNKFDVNGNRTYGTYVGPIGGGISIVRGDFNNGNNFNTLFTAPDGTTYLSFQVEKGTGQTGIMPTTATAFQSNFTGTAAQMVMIFKPDNSLQYASYFNYSGTMISNATMSSGGDLYLQMSGSSTLAMPAVTTGAASTTPGRSIIMRFDKTGSIVASTWQPATVTGIIGTITTNPTNGDVITMNRALGKVQVFDAGLTTLKSNTAPFGASPGGISNQIGVDAIGRLHVAFYNTNSAPVTTGAVQSIPNNLRDGAYYGITDCTMENLVYGTYLSDQLGDASLETNTVLNDFELNGCNSFFVGQTVATVGFPVTPTAYTNNGTATISGYRITPTNIDINRQGFMTKFNYPVMRANTNVLAAPAVTNFCADAGVLPINGTPTTYITPTLLGTSDANPAPTPTHYQWQIANSASGPWTDIPDSDKEDLSPEAPATTGTYHYRRLVRQTPFEFGTCAPSCDVTNTSNVIALSFSANKTHATNLSSKTYGFCKTGTLSVSTTITPSADGAQAPYTYKLTTFSNMTAVAQGQSGTVTASPFTINLTLADEGKYLLQVTDSRGCTSFDTLNAEFLKQDAGSRIQFTCGATTIKLGPASPAGEYANFATNTFSWSPGTGLDNVNLASPTLSVLPAVGASKDYYLTLNGCVVDTVTVTNQSVTPLPTLPDISRCQGETAVLGTGVTPQTGVTYQWAPGLGITSVNSYTTILTTASAPAGVNVTTYYLKAENGTSGCVQYASQKVTVYRTPNQSFQIKQCMSNGCSTSLAMGATNIGTVSEPGISYSWQALIKPGTATTGMPTPADVIAGLTNPTGAMTDFALANATLGKTTGTYQVWLIRTSTNAANPACARQDTAFYDYCTCGSGGNICALALGALPSVACGGPNNKIGPVQYTTSGTYIWTRLDGTPINNELFDPITKVALTPGGPHPNQVIANPTGLVAVSYRLTLINPGADTCRIDIKVFPSAIGKPNVAYTSPQAVCQGSPYTITGPAAIPGFTYLWSPANVLATPADTAKALPNVAGLSASTSLYVLVTDPSTGCSVQDTVSLVVSPVTVAAGDDATFCTAGASVSVGAGPGLSGYTYKWTAIPAAGVVFGNSTSAQTTVTLPATAAGGKITLFLSATNGSTAANCSFTDSMTLTASASPAVSVPPINNLCAGGTLVIGPVSPAGLTYAWSGPGITGPTTGNSVSVTAAGTYTVTAAQGSCVGSTTVTVSPATPPTVDLSPPASCTGPTTIGVNNTADNGWVYTWNKLDGLKSYALDFSTITVEPTVTTTYTLMATHTSGCVLTFPIVVTASAYVAQLPGSYNFCEGGSSTLALNAAPSGATYAWTASPASALAYLSSASTAQPTVNLVSAPAGTYSYSVTVSYGAGCQSTASTTVRVGKKISNVAGFDADVCLGTCTTIGLDAVAGVNYEWSASPADPSFTNIYSANPTVCPTVTTTYTVKYRNESGCVFTDNVLVNVLPTPTLTVKDVIACGPVTLDLATAVVATTGTTKTYWLDAAATIAATNPVSTPGTYYIKSSDATCSVIERVRVTFNDLPSGTVQATYNCATETGILQISNVTAGARYDYSTGATYTGSKTFATASIIGGGGILATSLPTPPAGGQNYTVRLFSSDSTCTQDFTVKLISTCPVACTLAATAVPGACAPATNQYTVSGTISLTSATAGTATITDGTKSTTVAITASTTSVAYSLTGLISGSGSHTVTISLPGCGTTTATYTAPTACSLAMAIVIGTPVCNTATNTYTATGTVSLTNSPAGSLTITDNGTSVTVVTVTASTTSVSYSLTGLSGSTPPTHTVVASVGTTTTSTTYATPASCTVCTISLTTSTLPNAQVNTAYSQTLITTGGTPPLSYSVVAGTLPTGLTLNPSTGEIAGTPTVASTISFTINVTDSKSCTDVAALSITTSDAPVCSLTATATPGVCNTLTNQYTVTGTVAATNTTGNQSLTITDGLTTATVNLTGNGPVSYTLTSLNSDGLTHTVTVMSSATTCGMASVTYTAPASCSVVPCALNVAVTPGVCNSATNQYSVSGTVSLTSALAGTMTITDGSSSTTVAVTTSTTTVAFTLSGLTSGSGSHTLVASLTGCGSDNVVYTAPASCTVALTELAVTVSTPVCNSTTNTYTATGTVSLTNATAGTLTITDNGTSLTTIIVTAGQTTASFSLSGVSNGPATRTIVATLSSSSATAAYGVPASCTVCTVNLTTTSLPNGQVNTVYSQTLTATGGTTPYTYTVLGTLPVGLTLSPTTGVISGTPTMAETSSFTIKVTDSKSCTDVVTLSITISDAPVCSLTATATPGVCNTLTNQYTVTGTVAATNTTGNQSLTITNGNATATVLLTGNGPVSYTLTSLNSDGLTHTVTVMSSATACGMASVTYTAPASCTVCSLSLTTASLPKGQVGTPYAQTITTSGGTAPLTYTVSAGSLPTGLSLNASSGVIGGIPTTAGSFTVTLTVTDSKGCSVSLPLTILDIDTGPICSLGLLVTPGSCNTVNNAYTLTGTVSLTNNTTGGTITITNGLTSTTLSVNNTATSVPFSLTGLVSDGSVHSVTASLSGCGSSSTTYTAPQSCTASSCEPPIHVCKGSDYALRLDAPTGQTSYQWYRNGIAITGATLSSYTATQAGSYSVVANGNAVGQCPNGSCCPVVIVEDSIALYQAQAQAPTCSTASASVANADGRILVLNWRLSDSDTTTYFYEVSLGSVFNPAQLIAGSASTLVPANGVLVANLANPASVSGQAYTVRISSGLGCYRDVVVTLLQTNCACPSAKCMPMVIRRTR